MTYLDNQPGEQRTDGLSGQASDVSDLYWEDETEFVRARPGWLRGLRAIVAVVILAVIGTVIYRGARDWFAAQLDPEGEPGAPVTVIVDSGSTIADIGSTLESAGVIPNATFFRYYAEFQGWEGFQAGEYTFQENSSADEARLVLDEGPKQIEYGEFLIPEGLWVPEILDRLAAQIPSVTRGQLDVALASGVIEPRYRPEGNESWEGLLFPAKYFIEDDITAPEVLALMSNEFAKVTGELGYGTAERTLGLSAYEVIIVASMIEAEAKTDADRPKIARVIYNRLAAGQTLGIDATIVYGKGVRGEPIFQSDLDTPGPYNTRHPESAGRLPPTPIAAPGRKSLEAAMNPTPGPWLYYVLFDEEGNHKFAETLAEHNANVADARSRGLLDQ